MRKIMLLKGKNHVNAVNYINEAGVDNVWLVLLDKEQPLHEYLTSLHDEYGLKNSLLHRMKICRFLSWATGAVSHRQSDGARHFPADIVELLKLLREPGPHEIIIEINDKKLFAGLLQQLIYLQYPFNNLKISLRIEHGNLQYIKGLFSDLAQEAQKALIKLENQPQSHAVQTLRSALEVCRAVLSGVSLGPFNLAVAASKKSGKSTLINCMLGHDLAPKSYEVPTPASCEYSSCDGLEYRLDYEGGSRVFASAASLKKKIEEEFKNAGLEKGSKFLSHGFKVQYPGRSRLPTGWKLFDTPGPDAAFADHRQIAEKTVAECDAVLFLMDYSKYLTKNEHAWLGWIKSHFDQKTYYNPLVILLNKMDLAMQEKGAKSWIKSTDFIRCRLMDIDPRFAECIIFPISALVSANFAALEDASSGNLSVSGLMEAATVWNKSLYKKIEALPDLEETALTAATGLFAEAERMKRLVDRKNMTSGELKTYSGIEQFLEYMKGSLEASGEWTGLSRSVSLCAREVKKIKDALEAGDSNLQASLKNICAPFLEKWQKIEKEFSSCPRGR